MADPRQITDLPVAATAADADLMLMRQGVFDKQVEVGVLRAGTLRAANNLSDLTDAALARNNLGVNLAGLLQANNNLSDVNNAATARGNLDVPSTSQALLGANNLSDLASAATARGNLNVASADDTALKTATNDFTFNIQDKMQIRNYSETTVTDGSITGVHSFDLANGNVRTATVTGNVTVSFANPPAAGQAGSMSLILTNGGAHTITWPGSVKWPGGTEPSLTAAGVDMLIFTTVDGGTTWYGSLAGADYS